MYCMAGSQKTEDRSLKTADSIIFNFCYDYCFVSKTFSISFTKFYCLIILIFPIGSVAYSLLPTPDFRHSLPLSLINFLPPNKTFKFHLPPLKILILLPPNCKNMQFDKNKSKSVFYEQCHLQFSASC